MTILNTIMIINNNDMNIAIMISMLRKLCKHYTIDIKHYNNDIKQ